jgi:hypothetical protein
MISFWEIILAISMEVRAFEVCEGKMHVFGSSRHYGNLEFLVRKGALFDLKCF